MRFFVQRFESNVETCFVRQRRIVAVIDSLIKGEATCQTTDQAFPTKQYFSDFFSAGTLRVN